MSLQQQVNELGQGVLTLGCGEFVLDEPLRLPGSFELRGSGSCTTILGPPGKNAIEVESGSERVYDVKVSNLRIDGRNGYIGIDLRRVTAGRIRDVSIGNVRVGILLDGLYNVIEDSFISAKEVGLHILDVANENIIRGGKVSVESNEAIGIWFRENNNNKVYGTAIEGNTDFTVKTGVLLDTGTWNAKLDALRFEKVKVGVHIRPNTCDNAIVAPYFSNVSEPSIRESNHVFWWGSIAVKSTGCV